MKLSHLDLNGLYALKEYYMHLYSNLGRDTAGQKLSYAMQGVVQGDLVNKLNKINDRINKLESKGA